MSLCIYPGVTVADVKAERERTNCGLVEAKRRLERQAALRDIDRAESVEDLRHVLRWLAERI